MENRRPVAFGMEDRPIDDLMEARRGREEGSNAQVAPAVEMAGVGRGRRGRRGPLIRARRPRARLRPGWRGRLVVAKFVDPADRRWGGGAIDDQGVEMVEVLEPIEPRGDQRAAGGSGRLRQKENMDQERQQRSDPPRSQSLKTAKPHRAPSTALLRALEAPPGDRPKSTSAEHRRPGGRTLPGCSSRIHRGGGPVQENQTRNEDGLREKGAKAGDSVPIRKLGLVGDHRQILASSPKYS